MGCSNSERSQTLFLILLYALLFTTKWSSASERMTPGDEPQCTSRFDYEYKVIQKLVQLEERLKDATETINKQKETQETEINTFKEWRKMQKETITALKAEISTLSDRLEESDKKLQEKSQSYDHFKMFQNITGVHIGFTVKNSKDNTDPRLFQTVIYNSSPGFNTATGKFLCVHPGMYLFTVTVIMETGAGGIDCYISVNGSNKARALANHYGSNTAYPSGSDTLIIHLKAGDEVYLTGCSSTYMYKDSSFSGVLIQPDIQ